MNEDPDPETRAELEAVLDDEAELRDRFGTRLAFGTAGLRGALGAGTNRMNRALVRRVAAAIGATLQVGTVVIGYDARKNSRAFAEDSACVLGAMGLKVVLFEDMVPTPRLAHAVRYLGAQAGIMVTASHNPPQDNGYKVYAGDGAQIVPPLDKFIAAAIDRFPRLDDVMWAELDDLVARGRVTTPPAEVEAAYFQGVQDLRVHPTGPLRIAYTPLHGVGRDSVVRALSEAGYDDVHVVVTQAEPDGSFPTVDFPNPEEPGALDQVLALAYAAKADLVLANDPDADRVCVALPVGDSFRVLTGNEVGCLLAEDVLAHDGLENPLVATTIVSSVLLSRIAAAHGATYAETLTGFKWLAHAGFAHEKRGGQVGLGYEEALGVSVGSLVRDKDGVSAMVRLADLAARYKSRGETLLDALANLYRKHGVHRTGQKAIKLPGAEGKARIDAAMKQLRESPPIKLGGQPVVRRRDLLQRKAWTLEGTENETLPKSNVLAWELADGSRVLARPSGTEPKLKLYAEAVVPWKSGLAADEERADIQVRRLLQEIAWIGGLG
ncbi:MAG: phospho-sugar mutase [Deltaproteobacteria bacterium]|nr:MAG: phospho-sugar mutase [Deltaproteobacteria bacterium]